MMEFDYPMRPMEDLIKRFGGNTVAPAAKRESINSWALARSKPRRILLAVTGISPQIVTETLYALAMAQEPAFIPTEIHVISTGCGLESIRNNLLSKPNGHFYRLQAEYALPDTIRFDETTLHGIKASDGEILDDINSKTDNEAAADQILAIVRELASDPDSAIHASIAGGRKTMGFFMGYAMSLLGRNQDSLSHVLVSEPFERCENFYFPPREAQLFHTKSGQSVCSSKAEIMLAEIPFLRLGHDKTLKSIQAGDSYSRAVQRLQDAIDEPMLSINIDSRTIKAHDRKIRLSAAGTALLTLFAIRAKLGKSSLLITGNEASAFGQLLPVLEAVDAAKMDAHYELAGTEETKNTRNRTSNLLSRYRKRLEDDLVERLGELADHYLVNKSKKRPVRYSLDLKPTQIEILGEGIDQLIDAVRYEMEEPSTREETNA